MLHYLTLISVNKNLCRIPEAFAGMTIHSRPISSKDACSDIVPSSFFLPGDNDFNLKNGVLLPTDSSEDP